MITAVIEATQSEESIHFLDRPNYLLAKLNEVGDESERKKLCELLSIEFEMPYNLLVNVVVQNSLDQQSKQLMTMWVRGYLAAKNTASI